MEKKTLYVIFDKNTGKIISKPDTITYIKRNVDRLNRLVGNKDRYRIVPMHQEENIESN